MVEVREEIDVGVVVGAEGQVLLPAEEEEVLVQVGACRECAYFLAILYPTASGQNSATWELRALVFRAQILPLESGVFLSGR